jgi:hypothetical protein
MSTMDVSTLLPHLGELTPDALDRWVAAVLAQEAALRAHDARLYPRDPALMAAAERLHEAWRSWAEDAEAVLRQVQRTRDATGVSVPRLDELRDAVGRALAMLQLPPSVIAKRREQVARGDVYSIEEVRRELRLGHRG